MNPLLKKIVEATRLTRLGRVTEATAALRRTLSGDASAAAGAPVWRDPSGPARTAHPGAAVNSDEGVVLDGLVREVKPSAPADAGVEKPARQPVGPRFDPPAADAPAPGFFPGRYDDAAGWRAYKLYRPAGRAGRKLPLVVMLHGCTQDPDDFAIGTRMNELAEAEGCVVLYPQQPARSNAHKCWNWFVPGDQKRGQGEPALLAGMTRHIVATEAVDPDRVYVAGLSAGGAMAAILAREYADLYAAAGIHSGLPAGAAHDVASAFAAMKQGVRPGRRGAAASASTVPVIVFQGSADSTVAPANADAVIAAALGSAPAAAEVTRPSAESAGGPSQRAVTRTVWRDASAGAASASLAELWLVEAAPHAWAGGASQGSYTDPAGPDASAEMLRFFREHPKVHA